MKRRLAELAAAHALRPEAADRLAALLELLAAEPSAITAVRDPAEAVDVHVADALAGLEAPEVRKAAMLADLGAGGGIPGLVLAIALPDTRVVLVESVARKCTFLERAIGVVGAERAQVVCARAEAWPQGLGAMDVVTARALAALPVLAEYAAPLLRRDGALVAWKGRRDEREAAAGAAAAGRLGLSAPEWRPVLPFPGVERHLVVARKVAPTPSGFPRRPGMARKRPLGA